MDTRVATTKIRIQKWVDIFRDRTQSGLKVDDYCKEHQLSRNSYYYWMRHVTETDLSLLVRSLLNLKS